MILRSIQEAPLIWANDLLNPEKNKKSLKTIQQEIETLSQSFGKDFDKGLYVLLLDSIDFKDAVNFINSKNIKIQYFLADFQKNINKEDFINFLAEVFMKTKNSNTVKEIFEGLVKVLKINDEEQLKILLSFVLSKNPRYLNDSLYLLNKKCVEIENDKKTDLISPSISKDIVLILSKKNLNYTTPDKNILNNVILDENIDNKLNYYEFLQNSCEDNQKNNNLSDIDTLLSMLDTDNEKNTELIPMEKLYEDLGPLILNKSINLNLSKSKLIDDIMTPKRVADFIINILKKPVFTEDKEIIIMNRVFLRSLELDQDAKNIEESIDKQQIEWNIDNFYKIYKNQLDILDPKDVFHFLDNTDFIIKDKKKFELFLNILKTLGIIKKNNFDPFFDFIFTKWENEESQIKFLQYLVANPQTETFTFKKFKGKRVKQHFELNYTLPKSSISFLMEPWTCIPLLEVLLQLSHRNNYIKVKKLFDWPIQNIPEIIALGLMQITQKPNDFLYDELIQEVLTLFFGNHMNSFSVIEEAWNANKELVINAIANMYNSSPDLMNLSRILDITQKLKESLLLLVNCNDYKFAVNLAILAVKRDFLHIEQWLKERIENVGDDFVAALVDYIKENLIVHCKANNKNKENILEKSQLTLESLAVILENLITAKHSTNPKISISTEEEVHEIYKNIFETFKELNLEPLNSKEIEETANSIFQSMFKGETKVWETIEKLKHLKDSKLQKDREIYACMIHCLLDEYRFYHQYPEKQLNIVSSLFGQIINNKLIDGVIETIALKYILEGIKKGNGPLFIFGTTALQQFIDKLQQMPSYTKSLVETKQLKNDPILYESVIEKYSSMFANDPATNNNNLAMNNNNVLLNANNNNNVLLNANLNNNNNLNNNLPSINNQNNVNQPNINNLIGQQNLNVGLMNPLSGNMNTMNNNNIPPALQQHLKNKIYNSPNGDNNSPNLFENDLQNVMKNNQQRNNQNEPNFNPLLYNMQQNNKNPATNEQFFGINNLNNNMNNNLPNNIPLNTQQLLQGGIPQNINNLMNNQLNNLNLVNNNNNNQIDANNLFGNSNNNITNISNTNNTSQTNLSNSLNNISITNNTTQTNNILNNSNTNNNLSNLNDSFSLSNVSIDNKNNPQKPTLLRSASNTPTSNILNNNIPNTSNNNMGIDFTTLSLTNFGNLINNNNITTIPINSNNNSNISNVNEIFNNTNDVDHKIQPPNQDIIDQIQFIFNQISKNNMSEKAKEINKVINNNENLLKWFSDFFIVNRISTEINNHEKYFELLNFMNNKELINYQIKDTLYYINKLLNSKTLEEQKERGLLKYLGSWLGYLTLQRNKPILAKDIDFRNLLCVSYETGKLSIILPFISKIFEKSLKTKVFTIKNPWMQAILSIIHEIYCIEGIRDSIKFEIENLFTKLGINDFHKFLKSHIFENKKPIKNSMDFNTNLNNFTPSNPKYRNSCSSINNAMLTRNNSNTPVNSNNKLLLNMNNPQNNTNNNQLNNNLNINLNNSFNLEDQQLTQKEYTSKICQCQIYLMELSRIFESHNIFQNNLIMKNEIVNIVTKILYESINNIINPVIERAVNISLVTTKELVIKDFQFEPSEKKFKDAAINSIKSLAGALALVTCKEPLRMSYSKRIKDYLLERHIDTNTIEDILKIRSTADLLNIGCSYIYNYVQKKAAESVLKDEIINKEIEKRVNNEKQNNNFVNDSNPALMKIVSKLPPSLKPNINGLTEEQLAIYDNYPKIYGESINLENNKINNNNILNSSNTIVRIMHVLKEILERPNNNLQKFLKNYEFCMKNIQTLMKEHINNMYNFGNNNSGNNNEFEEGSEELKLCEKCILDNKIKDLNLPEEDEAKLIIQMAYTTYLLVLIAFKEKNNKLLNVYIAFIKGWIKYSNNNNIQKEITKSLMQNVLNQICFNVEFHTILFKNNILYLEDYQDYLLNYLEQPYSQKLCINLLKELKKIGIFNPNSPNNNLPNIYPFVLDKKKCHNFFILFGKHCKLPSDLNIISQQVIDYKVCNIKDLKTYQLFNRMCNFAFNKIISTKYPYINIEPAELGKKLNNFIESPFVNNDEQLNVFIMLITELCVKHINFNKVTENYPDNQARCIYTLLMAVPNTINKLKMFGNILNGIFKTFHHDYVKTNLNFNQRPYYKLFYTFIVLLDKFNNNDKVFNSENTKIQYMNLLAEFFRILAPSNYPAFAFAWLDLISSKPFINSFLCDIDSPDKEKNTHVLESYLYLIIDLISFLKNCGNNNINENTSKIFMDYVYKYIFLLSSSFPEFVSGYYYICLISLPHEDTYMQFKNLILSTTPKNIPENIKNLNFVDKDIAQEIANNTLGNIKIENLFDISSILKQYQFMSTIDEYKEKKNIETVKSMCEKLNQNKNKGFNFYVINAILIYWADKALKNNKNIKDSFVFFFQMMQFLEIDNRDHLINSLLNELRFPSNKTLSFLLIITYILCEIHNEQIEEHIIMSLFERLFIKPIPWGIELMFKKLLKGENYNLFGKGFIRNFNGGIAFINTIKDFIEDKNAQKYNISKYIVQNKNVNEGNMIEKGDFDKNNDSL